MRAERAQWIVGVLAVMFALSAGSTRAEGFELTPLVGVRIGGQFEVEETGEKLELDEGAVYGLMFGFPLDDQSVVEVEINYQGTELQGGELFNGAPLFPLDVISILAGGRWQSDHEKVKGFVAGGLGLSFFDPGDPAWSSEYAIALSIGGGAMIPVSQKLAVRLEGRGIGTFMIDQTGVFCSGGVCAVSIQGDGFLQAEFRAGLAISF